MIAIRIQGATRTIGESQGYIGIPIRDELQDCAVNGPDTPVMVTAWAPTREEIMILEMGAPILLHILGTAHPPVRITVGEPE